MIDKKEDVPLTPDAALLSQTCQHLESKVLQFQSEVRSSFARLYEVLQSREKQLLRQIDVAHNQQLSFIQAKTENASLDRVPVLKVEMEAEKAVQEAVTALGSVTLEGAGLIMLNGDGSFLQSMEDYQDAIEDHMALFKPVPLGDSASPESHETVIRFNHINLPCDQNGIDNSVVAFKPIPQDASPSQNSQETVIRFNYSSLPVDFVSTSEKCDIASPNEEVDSSPDTQGKHENCNLQDADADKCNTVQSSVHPAQVQQWLKQLSAETETEPSVGEPKNFGPL